MLLLNSSKRKQKKGIWDSHLQQKYDNIDSKATQIMLAAENATPKFKTLRTWSLELGDHSLSLQYYNRYKYHKGSNINITTVKHLATQAKIKFETLTQTQVLSL